MNALKLENEKLKKAAQERWEQDKADHHSKKGKMNRIAELKVRMLLGDAPWCVVIVTWTLAGERIGGRVKQCEAAVPR